MAAGRPALLGSRLDVAATTTIRQNGGSVEEAASYLEIPVEQLEAAARYYGEYKGEVDELIDRLTEPGQAARGRRERGVLCTRATEDAEMRSARGRQPARR